MTEMHKYRETTFVRWRVMFVGPQYEPCSSHPAEAYNFQLFHTLLENLGTSAVGHSVVCTRNAESKE
jgi:hypothetical protein